LKMYGIKIKDGKLWIATNSRLLTKVFESTKIFNYTRRFKSIKNIEKTTTSIRFGAMRSRAIGIPWKQIDDMIDGKDDDTNQNEIEEVIIPL